MPRQPKGGESKQGLVITLVFTVILSMALGVVAYLGFADKASLKDRLAKAETEKKIFEKERDLLRYEVLRYVNSIGLNTTDEEKEALMALGIQFEAGRLGQGVDKAKLEDMNKRLKIVGDETFYDRATKLSNNPYFRQLKKLREELKAAETKVAELDKTYNTKLAELQATLKNAQDDSLRRAQQAEAAKKEVLVLGKGKTQEFLALEAMVAKISEEKAALVKTHDTKVAEFEVKINGLNKDLTALRDRYRDVQARVAPVNLLDHDKPKGKIVSLNRTGDIAYINLGSADHLKPQLSFAVFGKDQYGKVDRTDRKAAIEVLDVLQPHLASARIIEVVSPGSNPVLVGDQLFNPAWSPNLKKHIAIAGVVDLTGDGLDDTQEFIRTIEKQDVVVDGYLDLREENLLEPNAFKGKMGFKTDYLVLGQIPEIDQGLALRQKDPRLARVTQVIERLSELQSEAGRKGITIVPARRFMALIGYRLPKNSRKADYDLRGGVILRRKAEPDR